MPNNALQLTGFAGSRALSLGVTKQGLLDVGHVR